MPKTTLTLVASALTLLGCSALDPDFGVLQAAPAEPQVGADAGPGAISFARDIRPLMNRSDTDPNGPGCKKCHYATEAEHIGTDLGGLELTTLGALRLGGTTSGKNVVKAGDPSASVIVQKLEGTYGFGSRMPRSGPPYWKESEILLVRDWIRQGARGGDGE